MNPDQTFVTSIQKLSIARQLLVEAKSMDDILNIRDIAEAARVYAQAAKLGLENQNEAAEIKIRAERKAGEMLSQMPKNEGGRPIETSNTMLHVSPTLADLGIERMQSSRWQTIARLPEEKFEEYISETKIEKRELTTAGVIELAQTKPHVINNSGNNEWYTPSEYIEAARKVLGEIDLDPASSEIANKTVQAHEYFSIENDGLNQDWFGRVWMNPPYSGDLVSKFTEKLALHYSNNDISQAIILVNNATETGWFQDLLQKSKAVCFLRRRIKFNDVNGVPNNSPLQGQAVLYFGNNTEQFADGFKDFGVILYGHN